jgi:Zn-dependent M28 family amino/carboxypeptidase
MKTAHDLGARGLVYIYPEVIVNNNSDLIPGFYQALISEELADQVLRDAGTSVAALKQRLRETKRPASMPLNATFDMAVKTKYVARSTAYNIVGYVEGSDPALSHELVVVGGHFDGVGEHIGMLFPGADDNASGSAVVMEVAKAFAANGTRPKRSVMFALFAGEEMGSSGADYFVAHVPAGMKVAAFLNYDMEGVGDRMNASLSPWLLDRRGLIDQADAGLGIVGRVGEMRGIGNRSGDVAPFFAKGIPIASVMSNGKRPAFSYHQPADSLEIVQPQLMADIARLTYRWAFLLADQ